MTILFGLAGLIALSLLFGLAGRSESPLTLILAGIAISTLAGAGISLALNLSSNPFAAMEIMTWLHGSLENRSFDHVWIALPCIAIGGAMLAAMNTASEYGFGAVIASLPGFLVLADWLKSIPNPLVNAIKKDLGLK